jgi:hypothetical protein
MGSIHATSLAYRRSVHTANPAVAQEYLHVRYLLTNWSIALVCRPDPARLLPASTALAGAGGTGGGEVRQSRVAKTPRDQFAVIRSET